MTDLKNYVIGWILSMVHGFDNNVDNVVTILTKDIFNGTMYTMAQGVANIITPIALTIITICFLLEFLKITIKMDVLKYEYGLRVFFKLVFAKVAIDVSFKLLSAIYATGSEWMSQVGTVGSTLGASVETAITANIQSISTFEALGLLGSMAIAFIAIWIAGLIVNVMAYARMFELLVYMSIAPLPCAFLPVEDGGGSRIPKKYFLSFAGVVLQGLFIIISIKLYQAICDDTITAAVQSATALSDIVYNMLMAALVLVVAVIKSGQWAKGIFDAA